jgi:hypothetical protein
MRGQLVAAALLLTAEAVVLMTKVFHRTGSDEGAKTWMPVPGTAVASEESRRPANVENGYGDYEAAVVDGRGLLAAWTDSRALQSLKEEIVAARIEVRRRSAGP